MAIIAASISLALGLTLPGIRLTRFYFFATEYSLISTVYTLIARNQIFLGSLVFIFSIMLPVFKLCYLVMLTTMPDDILRAIPASEGAGMARQVVHARRAGAGADDLLHQEPGRL